MSDADAELVSRHRTLAAQASAIAREMAAIDRHLHDLLTTYLAQCAPERSKAASWRWEIRSVDEHGVLFANDSFFLGFDTPGVPREVFVPMSWIRAQAALVRVEDSCSPAHVPARSADKAGSPLHDRKPNEREALEMGGLPGWLTPTSHGGPSHERHPPVDAGRLRAQVPRNHMRI